MNTWFDDFKSTYYETETKINAYMHTLLREISKAKKVGYREVEKVYYQYYKENDGNVIDAMDSTAKFYNYNYDYSL